MTQHLGVSARAAVTGDLVVLDFLSPGDQPGIPHCRFFRVGGNLIAFLHEAGHRLALPAFGCLAQGFEYLFQTLDMSPCLIEVILKRLPQFL